jgi:hypothetical protein
LGDGAFDAVDLLLWQLDDASALLARAQSLAAACGEPAQRMLDWCTAFAGTTALDLTCSADAPVRRIQAALSLAEQAPAA